mmetsp:Transcript_80070/g.144537  ORF Transcript_80070/g.144537 Transcript_80070/m.144537 type:complete len:253 (-) Transcript_80070:702-1460(-)
MYRLRELPESVPKKRCTSRSASESPPLGCCSSKATAPSVKKMPKTSKTVVMSKTLQMSVFMAPVREKTMIRSSLKKRLTRIMRVPLMTRSRRTMRSMDNFPTTVTSPPSDVLAVAYWDQCEMVSKTAVKTTAMSKTFHIHSLDRKNCILRAIKRRIRSPRKIKQKTSPTTSARSSSRSMVAASMPDRTSIALCSVRQMMKSALSMMTAAFQSSYLGLFVSRSIFVRPAIMASALRLARGEKTFLLRVPLLMC